jgi:flagellar M-ring protein FliF
MAVEAPKSFGQAISQIGAVLRGLTFSQRLMLAVGAALVGITLWVFVGWMGTPKYVTLYSGLSPQEAQDLGGRLTAANIPYQLSPDGGSVLVPDDKLDTARLQTAAQGLPRNARMGFEIFDTPDWAGSDFTEKVNYQRALEGELERTLQTLSEVQSARVHLVLPHESLFTDQETEAKASVVLKTRGGELSEQAQRAIPQLVASAVEGLQPQNVTVVDADTNTSLLKRNGQGENGSYDLDRELSKSLVQTLEPVVGAGHVRASVHVEYDPTTGDNTEEIYDPKAVATLTEQKTEETAGGAGPAGVPGTASNLPSGKTPALAVNSDTQSSRSQSETYAVSKTVRHTNFPAGRIKRISAAVLVDDAEDITDANGKRTAVRRKRTPAEMQQISQLAAAAIGIDAQRGDVLTLENLSFQQPPEQMPSPPTRLEKIRQIVMDWSSLLRYAGILLLFAIVYFLILRPVKKQVLTAFRELPGRMAKAGKELGSAEKAAGAPGAIEIELPPGSEQGQRAAALKKQLTEKIKAEPAAASRLVQTWIRESEQ